MVGPLPDWKTRAEWKGEGEALEVRKGTQKLHRAILVAVLWPYVLHFQASRVGFHRDLLGFILHHSHRSFCVLRCFFTGAQAGLELWILLPPPPKLRSQACAETGSP